MTGELATGPAVFVGRRLERTPGRGLYPSPRTWPACVPSALLSFESRLGCLLSKFLRRSLGFPPTGVDKSGLAVSLAELAEVGVKIAGCLKLGTYL